MTAPRVEHRDEGRLVAEAAAGDRRAFAELVRRHQQEVYTLAVRLLADRELAADVMQDALIRAWRALPDFRGDAAFGTWIYRITVNAAWSARRRARRHQTEVLEEAEHPVSDDVAEAGEAMHIRQQMIGALGRLPVGLRSVVVMKDVYGWTHAEIADALDISVAAAKVRLHRGRTALRRDLEAVR